MVLDLVNTTWMLRSCLAPCFPSDGLELVVLLACYVAVYLALLESKENVLVGNSVDDLMNQYEEVNEH